MSNEKEIRVLEHRIAMLGKKISQFEKRNVPEKIRDDLMIKKLKYETELEEIKYED